DAEAAVQLLAQRHVPDPREAHDELRSTREGRGGRSQPRRVVGAHRSGLNRGQPTSPDRAPAGTAGWGGAIPKGRNAGGQARRVGRSSSGRRPGPAGRTDITRSSPTTAGSP